MPGFLKKAQVYLGLGPDDEYDDFDEYDERPAPPAREARDRDLRDVSVSAARPAPPTSRATTAPSSSSSGTRASSRAVPPPPRPVRENSRARAADGPDVMTDGSVVRTLATKERPAKERLERPERPSSTSSKPAVRAVRTNAKPVVVSPSSFNGAQELADKFKGEQAVILNLQGTDKELSRRLLDFCSGVCYALGGNMEKVAGRVYLLTPANVEVSAEERKKLRERGIAG